MNIIGSSSVSSLGNVFSATGPVGITGITGPKGITGSGLTGNTGANVSGVSLINRYILTTFSDGTTFQSLTEIYGVTGPSQYVLAIENLGTGLSLATGINNKLFSDYYQQEIVLRGITFVNNTNSLLSVNRTTTASGSYYTVNLQLEQGVTVASSSSSTVNLLEFNSSGAIQRINQAYGVTLNNNSPPNIMGVNFVNANIIEKVRGAGWTGSTGAVNCQFTGDGITCSFNPFVSENDSLMFGSRSKVFVADFKDNKATISLISPPSDGNAYGFDLYLRGALNPTNLQNRFRGPIHWSRGIAPCFSVDGATCSIKMSFLGFNGVWYPAVVSSSTSNNCSTYLYSSTCSSVEIPELPNKATTSTDTLGACCTSNGTCYETTYQTCSGYFQGPGTTCGTTLDSICSKPGVCCRKIKINGIENTDIISDQLTCYECLSLTDQTVKFAGNYTTKETTNCNNVFNKIGACCNGRGGCSVLTREECDIAGGFYQGDDVACVDYYGVSVCSSGTGPCCINGTCFEQTYLDCFNNNGYFGGKDKTCSVYRCPSGSNCVGFIDGVPVYEGSKFAGGIVVGLFDPKNSEILGAKSLFYPIGLTLSSKETVYNVSKYKPYQDYFAYGVTNDCGDVNNSYLIIVYPNDIAIDEKNTLKNTETEKYFKNMFIWGGTASSWGPITNQNYEYDDIQLVGYDYRNTHLNYSEGYWSVGFTGATQANDKFLLHNTFATCNYSTNYGNGPIEKQFAKPVYNLHGVWFRSWGLMNTIRAVSAYNFYTLNNIQDTLNLYSPADFVGSTATNAFIAVRFVLDGITSDSQGNTPNPNYVSQWYLPSHDELGFIASKTVSAFGFNINQILIGDGQPLNGTYWTSTGAFDYGKNEGIYDGSTKPNPGSVAIAMHIDINGNLENYKIYKSSRKEEYKVRPIRMIRCDQITPNSKLWNIVKIVNSNTN